MPTGKPKKKPKYVEEEISDFDEPLTRTRLHGRIAHCLPMYWRYLSNEIRALLQIPWGKETNLTNPYEQSLGRLGGIYPLGLLLGKEGINEPDGLKPENLEKNLQWAATLGNILIRSSGWEESETNFCWHFGGYGWLPRREIKSPKNMTEFGQLVWRIEKQDAKDHQGCAVYNKKKLFPEGIRWGTEGMTKEQYLALALAQGQKLSEHELQELTKEEKEQDLEMNMSMDGSAKWREQKMEMQVVPLMQPGPTMQ